MKRTRIITIAIVLVGTVAIGLWGLQLKLRPHGIAVSVLMPLSYARQLRVGTRVYLGGVIVGKVENAPRTGLANSAITLRLTAPVANDSKVSFGTDGVLGDLCIRIQPGNGTPVEDKGELQFATPAQGAAP